MQAGDRVLGARLEAGGRVGGAAGPGDEPGPSEGIMPPAALRALLRRHGAVDERERRSVDAFLAALDGLEDPYDQDAHPTHVTASAVVVGRRGTVLHVHRRLGRWLQPGGHVDPGEGPPAAARREAQEETGLVLVHPSAGPVLLHVDVHPAARGHRHLDLRYVLVGTDADPAPPPGESPQARWFDWEEARAVADEGLVTALSGARRWWERYRRDEPWKERP